jgi:hypothetical protein
MTWRVLSISPYTKVDADTNDFIPPGSYLKDWLSDSESLFSEVGDPIDVYSRATEVHTAEGAALMLAASTAFRADDYVSTDSIKSWIEVGLADVFSLCTNIHRAPWRSHGKHSATHLAVSSGQTLKS